MQGRRYSIKYEALTCRWGWKSEPIESRRLRERGTYLKVSRAC